MEHVRGGLDLEWYLHISIRTEGGTKRKKYRGWSTFSEKPPSILTMSLTEKMRYCKKKQRRVVAPQPRPWSVCVHIMSGVVTSVS